MNNNIIFLSIIVGIMAIHSNTISGKYKVTDFLLLICIICSSIYIFYYNKTNENMGNVYLRTYENINPDPETGLTSEIISQNMKESSKDPTENSCRKECDSIENCKYYKITNSNLDKNNIYDDFDSSNTITGVCTMYKAYDYNQDKVETIAGDTNLHSYLYKKIFRLYILKNHPDKGLYFIPHTYNNGKFQSLITKGELIKCKSDTSSKENSAYCTSHGLIDMQNLIRNDKNILDFRSMSSNKLIEMDSDSNIILEQKNKWLFAITFMISKKKIIEKILSYLEKLQNKIGLLIQNQKL